MTPPLLEIDHLRVEFAINKRHYPAVDDLSLRIDSGQTVGLVGESGCGKSVSALAIMRLLDGNARIDAGQIRLRGHDILQCSSREMRRLRGNRIAMIFQDPMSALNPVISIGEQMAEPLRLHQNLSHQALRRRIVELLDEVGLPSPGQQLRRFPHELSGGQRQRVMIAMALSCQPELLIADEPTTALDVTIQAQILSLLQALQRKYQTGILLITHDLGIIAEIADRVAVMYAGSVVEFAPVNALFDSPQHPYTNGLMQSTTHTEAALSAERLASIPGLVPDLDKRGSGCQFYNRCPKSEPSCAKERPQLQLAADDQHGWRCIHPHS